LRLDEKKKRNYSPNLQIVAAISSLHELTLADLLSCRPLLGDHVIAAAFAE